MEAASGCDYNLVEIDEFDALSIEVRLGDQKRLAPSQPNNIKKYPAKHHARKVKEELGVTSGLIYLLGQETRDWEDTDGEAPFRQRRYAFYLSGANFPGTVVTYDIGKDSLTLWIPVREPFDVLWHGTLPSIAECAAEFDLDAVRDIKGLRPYLEETLDPLENPPTVYIPHEYMRPPLLSWERPSDGPSLQMDTKHLLPAMDLARAVKTPYEIAKIRKAVSISSEAHRLVQQNIKSLKSEAEVENMFIAKCRELGAKKQAYNVIAGSGPNAATLHYDSNNEDFGDRQLMVLDAGAEYECYASDVTRTFPLNGHFTNEAKKVYQIVAEMQDSCIAMIRPGASWAKISNKAKLVAYQGLLNIGILQPGRTGQKPDMNLVRAFFPHGLGHLVGLDTHDVISRVHISTTMLAFGGKARSWESIHAAGGGDNDRFSPLLKTGMVITCEPGIYFNKSYIENWLLQAPSMEQWVNRAVLEKYYPVCGCRIEDCILVTSDGYENLTHAPKGEESLKMINKESMS